MRRSASACVMMLMALLLVAAVQVAAAQDLPVLDPAYARLILQEVSGDASYEHVRYQTHFHRPRGSDGLWKVAEYFERKAREYGLERVSLIKQTSTGQPWNARFADLWIVEPEPERLASTLQSVLHLADNSRPADVTAQLIDIGAGTEEDLAGLDLAGKIVLTHGSLSTAMRRAVGERGALGVVWYPDPYDPESAGHPDQLGWVRALSRESGDFEPSFAFGLSLRQGLELRRRLRSSESPIVVRAIVDSAFDSEQGPEPWQVMVEAFIPGSEPELGQDIVLTGHMQEEATSANDDASGCANVLEIGRALNRLINEGRLPRPRRNLRFWWVTEIGSQRQYFADHPEAHHEMWVNINQDMVGANQAQDVMRVQNITRLPATRFHFFNDVVESVIEYMVAANNAEIAQGETTIGLYPDPHLSHLGTLHRYNAKMIFFHNSTDHMTFTEAPIGVPGVTFTNWPDNYIHSSDDDLWNIDRTQLGRSAAAVALMAYAMANADSASVPVFAAQTVGRGQERLARNLRLGLTWIATRDDKDAAYHDAVDQVRYAVERERLAITSLSEAHSSASGLVPPLLQELVRRETQAMRELELAYRQAASRGVVRRRQLSNAESRLSELKPAVTGGPREFLTGERRIRSVDGLRGLMAFEVLNAVNGERSGLDIHRYVAAEAREAGKHYYGIVTPEGVLQYLESVAAVGLIELR